MPDNFDGSIFHEDINAHQNFHDVHSLHNTYS